MSNIERNQRILALAQSEHAQAVVELLQHVMPREKLLGDNEYQTVVNAVKFDTRAETIESVFVFLDNVKKGEINISTMQ